MSSFLLIKTGLTFYLIAASCFFGVKVFAQRDTIYISSDAYPVFSKQFKSPLIDSTRFLTSFPEAHTDPGKRGP